MVATPDLASRLRLFVAIALPPAWKDYLAARAQDLERLAPGYARWVAPDLLHLTLVFLGDQPAARLPTIADAVAGATAGAPPFRLMLGAVGSFGAPPRVLWVGARAEDDHLTRLHGALVARLAGAGIPFDAKPLVAWVLCASITLQLHALALPDFLRSALHQESLQSEWSSLWWVVVEGVRSLHLGVLGFPAVICGLALVASGWLSILRRDRLAGMALVLPAFLGGATMLVLEHYLWPRFFFFSMGFAVLIAIRGAMTLPSLILNAKWPRAFLTLLPRAGSREGLGQRTGLVLACLMILASVLTLPKLYNLPKQDFTGARNWVERSRASDDRVVAVGLAGVAYGRYFAPQWSVAQSRAELDSITRGRNNVWLVYTLPIQIKAYRPEIWDAIQRDFQTVEVFPGTLGGGGVFVCRQRNPGSATQAADAKLNQAAALNPAK